MAEHRHRDRLVGAVNDLGTFFEYLCRIVGQQPDELLASGRYDIRPRQ